MKGVLVRRILIGLVAALPLAAIGAPSAAAQTETCAGLAVTITGTSGPDVIVGTPGDDVIDSGRGDDNVSGGGGNDFIARAPVTTSFRVATATT